MAKFGLEIWNKQLESINYTKNWLFSPLIISPKPNLWLKKKRVVSVMNYQKIHFSNQSQHSYSHIIEKKNSELVFYIEKKIYIHKIKHTININSYITNK